MRASRRLQCTMANRFIVVAVILLRPLLCEGKTPTLPMDFGKCHNSLTKLQNKSEVQVIRNGSTVRTGQATERCHLSFQAEKDHGICVEFTVLHISCDSELKIFTSLYEPDKKFTCKQADKEEWCTTKDIVTLSLTRHRQLKNFNDSSLFFSLKVKNVKMADIPTKIYMDSKVQCGEVYTMKPDSHVIVRSQREPVVGRLPGVCEIMLKTTSTEEYDQVCVSFKKLFIANCGTQLNITGVYGQFYGNDTRIMTCEQTFKELPEEICSKEKYLMLKLERKKISDITGRFILNITSKKHPRWEEEDDLKWELRALSAVKGLTIAVATIDTLVAIAAVVLSVMLRNPHGPWKSWAESMTKEQQASQQFVVTYPEVSMPIAETEAKS